MRQTSATTRAIMTQRNVHISIEQTHPAVVKSGNPVESANPPWSGVSCLGSKYTGYVFRVTMNSRR